MTVADREQTAPHPVAAPSRGRRRHGGAPAPAARFEPGRVAEARHRNPTWIVAGVLLVLLSALGGVLLFTSSDDRAEVLVAATDLEPGQAVVSGDLRIERVAVDGGVRSMPASAAADLVGQHPTGRIPAGTMLSPAMFDAAIPLGADEVVVGASLDPGEAPLSAVEVGAPVELIEVAVSTPGAAGAAPVEDTARTIGAGTVWAVEPVATGQIWLSLRVDRDVGMAVSLAAAQDRLRVALIGGTG
jgi:hypothetical protein